MFLVLQNNYWSPVRIHFVTVFQWNLWLKSEACKTLVVLGVLSASFIFTLNLSDNLDCVIASGHAILRVMQKIVRF